MSKTSLEAATISLKELSFDKASKLAENQAKIARQAKKLAFLTRDLPQPDKSLLSRHILAADGSCFSDPLASLSINIATATVYSSAGYEEYHLTDIDPVPAYEATLATSLNMRALEYKVLSEFIQDYCRTTAIDLVLVDGALSFPDENIELHTDRTPWIKEAFNKFVQMGNKLYDQCFEKEIPIVGITKRATSNKYILAVLQAVTKYNAAVEEVSKDVVEAEKEALEKWRGEYAYVPELHLVWKLFGTKEPRRTVFTEITKALRAQPPFAHLKNKILGMHLRMKENAPIFFLEVPSQFKSNLERLLQILVTISHYSLRGGYPMPLLAVHKRVELKRKKGKILAKMARRLLQEQGVEISPGFHELRKIAL